jgi:hypothetical protein
MKTGYSYVIIKHNDPTFEREKTYFESKYKKTKYAMFNKTIHKDGSETLTSIKYSNDIEQLQNEASQYISWYNYPLGVSKNIQGYLREI